MLALPERVAEPRIDQLISLEQLAALTSWKRRYHCEAELIEAGMELDEARAAGGRLAFFAWAFHTGRLGGKHDHAGPIASY